MEEFYNFMQSDSLLAPALEGVSLEEFRQRVSTPEDARIFFDFVKSDETIGKAFNNITIADRDWETI